MGAMKLIEDFSTHVSVDWSPRKTVKKTGTGQMGLLFYLQCKVFVLPHRSLPRDNFLGLEETGYL